MKERTAIILIVAIAIAFPFALVAFAACKIPGDAPAPEAEPARAGFEAERAGDGKRMVQGCIWFIGGQEADDLAFCDDGRVCVRGHGDSEWKCIRWPR